MAVTVAKPGHEHHQPAQHRQVHDDHPCDVADGGVEVLRESGNRERHRQAGKLDQHVR